MIRPAYNIFNLPLHTYMTLTTLHILNWKNIRQADLTLSPNINCFVGLNGQGKTNLLDAIYLLSFTKSAFATTDNLCISAGEQMAMVQGTYDMQPAEGVEQEEQTVITCGLRVGQKKQFRWGKKDYKRLIDHIGRVPLVLVCPQDSALIEEGSDERRRFMDAVISQVDRPYLEHLTAYNALLKQRNALLKQFEEAPEPPHDLLEVLEWQMLPHAEFIFAARTRFIEQFVPVFNEVYTHISGSAETVALRYVSQLQDRDLREAFVRTRQRDLILGWTSQGIHKDDLEMTILLPDAADMQPVGVKSFGSQGQQKTFVLSLKLAQALFLSETLCDTLHRDARPILLLDDIFDKLDSGRVERIVHLVRSDRFGQIFITDTDRQHLTDILRPDSSARIFHVSHGEILP